ncbi:hypothetical protein ACCO45_010337 [Purpureocillium lilacinum]|uniref:Uncharacterized protein n=1 Tax=Purpureocillium lilacinum TaxID=33203 RepID=A0ACC4DG03_PURLI
MEKDSSGRRAMGFEDGGWIGRRPPLRRQGVSIRAAVFTVVVYWRPKRHSRASRLHSGANLRQQTSPTRPSNHASTAQGPTTADAGYCVALRCVATPRLVGSSCEWCFGIGGAGPQECGSAGRPRSKVADLMAATLPPRQAPASSIPVELHKAHCRPVRPRPSSAGGATWLAGRLGTSRLELTCQWYPTDSSTPRQWRGARTHIGVHVPSCRTSSKFRAAVALLPRQSPAEPNPPCTHGTYMASWSAAIGLPPSNLHPLMIRFIIATAVPVSCSCHLGTRSCWARRVAATHLGSSPPAPSIEAIRFDPRSLADTKAMAIASGFCALRDHTPELPDPPFPEPSRSEHPKPAESGVSVVAVTTLDPWLPAALFVVGQGPNSIPSVGVVGCLAPIITAQRRVWPGLSC